MVYKVPVEKDWLKIHLPISFQYVFMYYIENERQSMFVTTPTPRSATIWFIFNLPRKITSQGIHNMYAYIQKLCTVQWIQLIIGYMGTYLGSMSVEGTTTKYPSILDQCFWSFDVTSPFCKIHLFKFNKNNWTI
jgi:hypothetical protein